MRKYNIYEKLKFDPENYDPMDVGAMSSFLRRDPDGVRNRISEGEWTVADLDKAISYVEDCENYGYSKKLVEIRCLRVAAFSCIPK